MVGRGAFGDPWLFAEINAVLEGREPPERPPLAERMATALRQVETAAQEKGERLACIEARAQAALVPQGRGIFLRLEAEARKDINTG